MRWIVHSEKPLYRDQWLDIRPSGTRGTLRRPPGSAARPGDLTHPAVPVFRSGVPSIAIYSQ